MRIRGRGVGRLLGAGAALGVTALVIGVVGPAGARPGGSATPQHHGTGQHRLGHVFIIMEENHAADHTIGDPDMPFLTQLAEKYGLATNYYGVTHTSEPNYIAATSGSNWGVNNDNGWNAGSTITAKYTDGDTTVTKTYSLPANQYDHANIVDTLEAHHISWAAYMDGMPSAGYLPDYWPSASNQLYASKHDPFMLYRDVRENPLRAQQVKPYSAMQHDLNSPHTPRYVWISPDQCNDLHGGVYTAVPGYSETPCPYGDSVNNDAADQSLKQKADAFLKNAVTTIMHSRAWTPNSVIFVTADENDYDGDNPDIGSYLTDAGCCDSPTLPPGDVEVSTDFPGGVYGGGIVPMVVVTPRGKHTTSDTAFNHYSMLLTIEQGFGLPELGYTSDLRQVEPMWNLIDPHHRR